MTKKLGKHKQQQFWNRSVRWCVNFDYSDIHNQNILSDKFWDFLFLISGTFHCITELIGKVLCKLQSKAMYYNLFMSSVFSQEFNGIWRDSLTWKASGEITINISDKNQHKP